MIAADALQSFLTVVTFVVEYVFATFVVRTSNRSLRIDDPTGACILRRGAGVAAAGMAVSCSVLLGALSYSRLQG